LTHRLNARGLGIAADGCGRVSPLHRFLRQRGLAQVPAVGRTSAELSRLFEPLLLVSADQGKTWQGPILVVAATPREVRWQAVLRTAGDTWAADKARRAPFPHSGQPEPLATREGPILRLATSGIHWTDDAGAHWHRLELPGTGDDPRSAHGADGRIFVLAHVGGDAYSRVDLSIVMDSFRLATASPPARQLRRTGKPSPRQLSGRRPVPA